MKISEKSLRDQVLLGDLATAERRKVLALITPIRLEQGATVFEENSPTGGIYLILKGTVEISKTTPDGWRQKLAGFSDGHFFGELSVIENRKVHTTTASAASQVDLGLIPASDFRKLEKNEPVIMAKIMRTIARVASANVHAMNDKLVKLLISY